MIQLSKKATFIHKQQLYQYFLNIITLDGGVSDFLQPWMKESLLEIESQNLTLQISQLDILTIWGG